MSFEYSTKFASFSQQTLYERLPGPDREAVRTIAFEYRLTFQEFRQVVEAARDLELWREGGIAEWWQSQEGGGKSHILHELQRHLASLRQRPKAYDTTATMQPLRRVRKPVVRRETDKAVYGMCPVASPKTICCNLRTIDAVESCVFGCSYCAVQTFYRQEAVFDAQFAAKLEAIELEPDRFYHIGTGQSSDSLVWGNKNGVLDALFSFARKHPRVLLELKTKSENVGYLLENRTPGNVVCSWSLNTPVIIDNEEHFTADLDRRLGAARRVADRGVRVAFHFHPMVYYDGWRSDYTAIAERVIASFDPTDVAFVSFGSVTLTRPVIKKIRELGNPTRILQMELVPDPHGKLTYPDAVKVEMFRTMYETFSPWHDDVFIYLCMEKAEIWRHAFGRVYTDNEAFERDFGRRTMGLSG